MRTLHLYLTRQVILTLMMTVGVFTLVLLLGNVLKEIVTLLVTGKVGLGVILKAIGLLIPYVMAYVLPFALLTATLLTFGRFSADNELTAVRASGVSLVSLVAPVVLVSILVSLLCAWFNLKIAPECRVAYKRLIMEVGAQSASNLITEERFIDEIPGIVLYVRKRDGNDLTDVRLYKLEKNEIVSRTSAPEAKINLDPAKNTISFTLFNPIMEFRSTHSGQAIQSTNAPDGSTNAPETTPDPVDDWHPVRSSEFSTDPIDLNILMKANRGPSLSEMSHKQLLQELTQRREQGIDITPVRFHLHRQVAFSFAGIGFALIGIPLGIRAHRRETSIGMAISLVLVLLYYSFFIFGEAMQNRPAMHPWVLVWIPNIIFQVAGIIMLWRANRQG